MCSECREMILEICREYNCLIDQSNKLIAQSPINENPIGFDGKMGLWGPGYEPHCVHTDPINGKAEFLNTLSKRRQELLKYKMKVIKND